MTAQKSVGGRKPQLYRASGALEADDSGAEANLLSNIYGVDIDSQRVDMTKLSLLLRVLEGENDQSISQQLKMFHERALPDLGSNIKCGTHSLGPDYFEDKLVVDEEERKPDQRIRLQTSSGRVMDRVALMLLSESTVRQKHQSQTVRLCCMGISADAIQVRSSKEWDIYLVFVEKGISLLMKGKLGYILPTNS